MKATYLIFALSFAASAAASAQVVPAAIGPREGPVVENLHYDVRYSQTAEFTTDQGNWQTGIASADLDYSNGSIRRPFLATIDGGYIASISGRAYETGFFQHLYISQGFTGRKLNILASDNESFMPQAPIDGFSGIPGSGEPIGGTGTPPASTQSILTVNTHTISNSANVEVDERLNFNTSVTAGGSSGLIRFPDTNGIDTDQQMARGGITRMFNSRTSLTGQYSFSHYTYPSLGYSSNVSSVEGSFTRKWTRQFSSTVSAGPQWISSSNSAVVPSSTRVAADAVITYKFHTGTANVEYSRGISGGSGYLVNAEIDALTAGYSREFARTYTIGFGAAYQRTAGLINGVVDAKYASAQISKRLSRYFLLFANYNAIDQSSSIPVFANVLTSLQQVVGFGISYSPRETRISH